eukprot:c15762_g1_i1.p1 GENE.c15762_g1_i1~~c15762_g1_i1.p1  ORF type:complete len:156 (+),score=25.26 c15762_g1_i1:34-468(+)
MLVLNRSLMFCCVSCVSGQGVLGNMSKRVLCYDGDELLPYKVGGTARDDPEHRPTNYLSDTRIVQAVSASIHSCVLTAAGDALSFGCGSDGRMGVMQFLQGLSGSRSRLKCYVSNPSRVELPANAKASQIAASRRHMLALVGNV